MDREHKLKELNNWFNKNKKSYNISGIVYDGVLVKTGFFNSKHIIVKWHNTYQQLLFSDLFTAALTKTFYKDDEKQIDELIKAIIQWRVGNINIDIN